MADKANNTVQKVLAEARRNVLRDLHVQVREQSAPPKTLFISYSGSGVALAAKAKSIAGEYGFTVITGFDKATATQKMSLSESIINLIQASQSFLGIWTHDFDAKSKPGRDARNNQVEVLKGQIPSVWMPFELGVAASFRKHFKLLVKQGTHRGYYEKPLHTSAHILFQEADFEESCRTALEALNKWHSDRPPAHEAS